MKNIVIWGLGKRLKYVLDSLKFDECRVVACIDKNKKTPILIHNKEYIVNEIESIKKLNFDYIIVTTVYISDIKRSICEYNVDDSKVIYFWEHDISNYPFLSPYPKMWYLAENEIKYYEIMVKNIPYEYGTYTGPIIKSAEELLKLIINKKKSLCRFGDGEFEIILGRDSSKFQKQNDVFTERLKNVLLCNKTEVVIAIADNYGSLKKYTDEAARDIRMYLTEDVRKEHMELLDMNRVYYDAYVSRAYMMYKDKRNADNIFRLYKELFCGRNIIMVEGNYTRTGYNNDLLSSASSVRRILCPDYNSFDVYSEIYNSICNIADKEDLILITLGSVATILSYDLACEGYQAIDLGQLDNEYEWYLRKCEKKEAISGKTVSDTLNDNHLDNIQINNDYKSQIVVKIKNKY
jgi:glycosyltransferase family protein